MKGSKKLDLDKFQKLIKVGEKEKKLKKKHSITENIDLKQEGLKVVIPKGRGIMPGEDMEAFLDGRKTTLKQEGQKKKKKKSKSKKNKGFGKPGGLFGMFFGSSGKEDDFLYKKKSIEITKKLPKGTILPKGSKIIRV